MAGAGIDPRSRRHPAWLAAEARRLCEAGWNCSEIVRILADEHALTVHRDTVRRWVDDDFAASELRRSADRNRRTWAALWTFQLGGARPSPEYQAAFVRRLRAERVTWVNVARVCSVVFGGRWDERRVQRMAEEAA